MSPDLRVLVFFVQDGEIIPDNSEIKVNKQLRHNVNFKFSITFLKYFNFFKFNQKVNFYIKEKNLQVGTNANIQIKSEPNSICALAGIDKSVTFMGKRNAIDLDSVNI